jgi:WD40 repeat protein
MVYVSKDYFYYQTIEPKWSPDSQYIVARWNNFARVYKVESDSVYLAKELEHKTNETGLFKGSDDVWDITFSPDGKYLAIGFCKYEIQLWEFPTLERLQMVKGCSFNIRDYCCIKTAFSPDG